VLFGRGDDVGQLSIGVDTARSFTWARRRFDNVLDEILHTVVK